MQTCIIGRQGNCGPQGAFPVVIAFHLPIKIGEVDGCRRIFGAQPQCGLVFGLGLCGESAPYVETCKCRTVFRPVGIEPLDGNKLSRGIVEMLAIG